MLRHALEQVIRESGCIVVDPDDLPLEIGMPEMSSRSDSDGATPLTQLADLGTSACSVVKRWPVVMLI